jgi:hypothetical protein
MSAGLDFGYDQPGMGGLGQEMGFDQSFANIGGGTQDSGSGIPGFDQGMGNVGQSQDTGMGFDQSFGQESALSGLEGLSTSPGLAGLESTSPAPSPIPGG